MHERVTKARAGVYPVVARSSSMPNVLGSVGSTGRQKQTPPPPNNKKNKQEVNLWLRGVCGLGYNCSMSLGRLVQEVHSMRQCGIVTEESKHKAYKPLFVFTVEAACKPGFLKWSSCSLLYL